MSTLLMPSGLPTLTYNSPTFGAVSTGGLSSVTFREALNIFISEMSARTASSLAARYVSLYMATAASASYELNASQYASDIFRSVSISSDVPGVGDGVTVGGTGVGNGVEVGGTDVGVVVGAVMTAVVDVTAAVEVGAGCGVGTAVGDDVGLGSGVDVGSSNVGWTGGGVGTATGSGRAGRPKQAVLTTAATSITAMSMSTFHSPVSYGMIPLPERHTPTRFTLPQLISERLQSTRHSLLQAEQMLDYYNVLDMLSDEERQVQATARRFLEQEAAPDIAEHWEQGEFPMRLIPMLGEMGYYGANLKTDYGTAGVNNLCYGLIMYELERIDSSLRSFAGVQSALVMYPIYSYGSEEQRREYMPISPRAR